ncbi:MAG: acyl-CoA dehydrogenase family protein [Thermoplasmataceae archaeon]|jgi:alkylation response protein AidB-like acyl-CoA dehydrogenase
MEQEQMKMLRENIDEFCTRNIADMAQRIENTGIPQDLVAKLAEQGFLGSRISPENGGSGLDDDSYRIVLERIARSSPSVSMMIFLENSIFAPLYRTNGMQNHEIASGTRTGTACIFDYVAGFADSVNIRSGKAYGTVRYSLMSDADYFLVPSEKSIYLVSGKPGRTDLPRLGFRGLQYSGLEFDGADAERIDEDAYRMIDEVLEAASKDIAAIAIGMAGSTIEKAMEYSKVRTTFGKPLKDYSPVAFNLSDLKSQIDEARNLLYSADSDPLSVKIMAIDLARRSSRLSLQIHGGYGYLEDFGVEKFYRDAMALSVFFGTRSADLKALSQKMYGENAGSI